MTRDRLGLTRVFCAILSKPLASYGVIAAPLSPPVQELIDVVDDAVDLVAVSEGDVVVERARFERVLDVARAVAFEWDAIVGEPFVGGDPSLALRALQPGDLDQLP